MSTVGREVPEHTVASFQPKLSDWCVVVVAINENGRLQAQLQKMVPYCRDVDVLIADGGSTDGSVDPEILEPLGVNTLLIKTGPGRLGAQLRMAFAWALDRGYRGVVTIDGNNKDGPDAIPRFVEQMEAGFDFLQGSRFVPGGISEHLPWSRWLAIRWIHAPAIRWASKFPYTDTTNGFRAYSAQLLAAPEMSLFRDVFVNYELLFYAAIRSAQQGFRVAELPVARRYPRRGPTPTKISPVRGNVRLLRQLFACCRGKYDPASSPDRGRSCCGT